MFNKISFAKNNVQLNGSFAKKGYDWWWHSFTAIEEESGTEVPFFIEFFLINPSLSPEKAILGQEPNNQKEGKRPSYLMVKAGCWGKNKKQLHRFYALNEVDINTKGSFSISASDCYADESRLQGKIEISKEEAEAHPEWMCDGGSISFDLRVEKQIAFNVGYGTSALFRFLKAFEMYWHAQGMKSSFEGTIVLDGRRYLVKKEKSFGYSDKNWGSDFTSPWVWLSSNDIVSNLTGKRYENSVFDVGGGCPRVFGIPLKRKLLSAFFIEGKEYEFNFSKFWTRVHTEFHKEETEELIHWNVVQSNRHYIVEVEMDCKKEDMLFVNYENPKGEKRYNHLYNGGNGWGTVKLYRKKGKEKILIEDLTCGHLGCEYGEFDW